MDKRIWVSPCGIPRDLTDNRHFLMDRDWLRLNKWDYITMPYGPCCEAFVKPLEGDVGLKRTTVKLAAASKVFDFVEDVLTVSWFPIPI
jgi:hypothetical protein